MVIEKIENLAKSCIGANKYEIYDEIFTDFQYDLVYVDDTSAKLYICSHNLL